MIVTAGNPGFPTRATMRFLSSKSRNAYHPPPTQTYYYAEMSYRWT
jgi:hypothetical protein